MATEKTNSKRSDSEAFDLRLFRLERAQVVEQFHRDEAHREFSRLLAFVQLGAAVACGLYAAIWSGLLDPSLIEAGSLINTVLLSLLGFFVGASGLVGLRRAHSEEAATRSEHDLLEAAE
jgi:hypothetical protein